MAEKKNIPIVKPVFGPEEEAAVIEPLRSGWVMQGRFVQEFEEKFAGFTGARFAIATTSCTTALQVALAGLALRPGDEVIVPAFTWIATANVVEMMGAKPVFCDIDLATYNIDPAQIEALVTPRTVGIVPVHLFGLAADIDRILAVAEEHGLWVMEDSACGFGACYRDQHVGTFGALSCFSFHPRKSITTGEGGMIITNDPEYDRLCRSLRNHGVSVGDRDSDMPGFLLAEYNRLGYNFRMTDLQGAVGVVQMDRGAWVLDRRRVLAKVYDDFLAGLDWLHAPFIPEGCKHGYQSYVTLFAPETPTLDNVDTLHAQRNALMQAMAEQGIATRQGTHVAALQNYYARRYDLRPAHFPNAYVADRLSLALPLYPQMTGDEQAYVCEHLQRVE